MAEIQHLPAQVSAQDYMTNLMVDADDEDDVRLHLSALCGDAKGMQRTLQDPATADWLNHRVRPYLSPPLRLAVTGGNQECVQLLVAAGANIELEDVKGQTPLFVATSQRKPIIMKTLLEVGANPEGSKKNRCSPLLVAVRDGFTEGVRLLLRHGADPEPFEQICTCVPGWPLHHAVVYAHFPCFLELVKGGAITNLSLLTNQICSKIVARLSIPHAILKYAKERPEFVSLYHESGGNLWQLNAGGITGSEESTENSPAKEWLKALLGTPLSLKSQCRIAIRRLLGRHRLAHLASLDVPSCLTSFLNYDEFSQYLQKPKKEKNVQSHISEE
ncbi:ankyrin repeat and SOCS box protein 12-like [Portunus trituberculatus]|uniref:ankyrin repeat and SOCS box protein 12-like n=1 Tax=Portunus trituberculatus TaxID=210409 RepID=UPI001E1CB44A|nr:ankyrin repeat and SOCS box protein 12-like [Portunus trituberculatus]XP_045137770.1 ankyrin repeat and SOCS box protein 12-like [Portunus trituberculatus]XP_045137771.1 ankyrin repeat and SOCS box protein 12-like [Portunus trituberculatus]XP_045137772.1 ankyrin repeat and SOCS box protein 12-like [Portunus trituberculatus]XP_045137773.1 ankyrin repeat and SOCS box protein 12-like [Portunus trituberculatus]XP_045137775.1 ankyrin repeat and SOCS box protein 12-like [Portunus trituberculatus]